MTDARTAKQEASSYELFIAAISFFSIFNLVLLLLPLQQEVKTVILIVDTSLCVAFLADFFFRLFHAANKSAYFFHQQGWLDLLGSLPFPGLRIVRLFRVVRVVQLIKRVGLKALYEQLVRDRASSSLYVVLLLCLLVVQYSSIFELTAERHAAHATITSGPDAVWYVIVTITTVGYGDESPVTTAGRIVGVVTMLIGVGLFGVLTGYLATAFLTPRSERRGHASATQFPEKSGQSPSQEPAPVPAAAVGEQLDQIRGEMVQLRLLLERLSLGQAQDTFSAEPASPIHPPNPAREPQ